MNGMNDAVHFQIQYNYDDTVKCGISVLIR